MDIFSKMFDLSIVIAAYNAGKTLSDTLDSVIANVSGINYEIIAIDDGSTDNTLKIIKKYAEKYPFIRFFSQENKGVGSAKNLGLKSAAGRYVWIVDADDVLVKNGFKKFNPGMLDEEIDILLFDYQRLDMFTALPVPMVYVDELIYNSLPQTDFILQDYPDLLISSHFVWNKWFRREFLEKNDICLSYAKAHEDILMHVKSLYLAKKIRRLDFPLVKYCQNNSAIFIKKDDKRLEAIKGFAEAEAVFGESPLPPEMKTAYRIFKAHHLLWICENSPENLREKMTAYNDEFLKSFSKREVFGFIRSIYVAPETVSRVLKLHGLNEELVRKVLAFCRKHPFFGKLFGI